MSPSIAIISDTHDNLPNLNYALNILHDEGIDTVIHCGDMTSPDTAYHFYGFRVIHTTGNGDHANGEIRRILMELNSENFSGPVFEGNIYGFDMAAVHGHVPGSIHGLAASKKYQYVLHGHTHRRKEEKLDNCTIINPGALGGAKREMRSFSILNLLTGGLLFLDLP